MRIVIIKSTGAIFEAQSDATEGTCIANAVSAGLDANDLEERLVTDEEYRAMLPKPVIEPSEVEVLKKALLDKGTLTAGDLATAKAGKGK